MNSINKRSTGAKGIPQSINGRAGHAPQSKPVVAQPKTVVSAQSVKQPTAPPAYRPQATPNALQPKVANGAVNRKAPVAAPVSRPQQSPKVLPVGRQAPGFRGTVQQKAAGVVQLVKCDKCGQSGHTKAKCYLHGNTKANPNSGAKQLSKAQRAFNNFQSYRSDFFSQNDVTVEHVTQFLNAGYSLHGHGSGGSGSGENQATKDDADTFVGWWRGKYG